MPNTYRKIEGTKAKAYLTRINAGWGGSTFDSTRTAVHVRDLAFLNGWCLVEASDATALPEKKCTAFDNGTESIPLEYNEDFITRFCTARDLRIDRHMAGEYLKFWLEYMRVGSERFNLIETVDDIAWREEPGPQARKFLTTAITPLTVIETTPTYFVFKGCVVFRDAIFECVFKVTYTGNITLIDRRPLIEDMAIADSFTGF